MGDKVLLDLETGETKELRSYVTKDQSNGFYYYVSQVKARNEKFSSNDNFGAFVWMIYNPLTAIFPELDNSDVARLVYLASFLGYDQRFQTRIQGRITTERLPRILKLSEKECGRFLKSMIAAHVLVVNCATHVIYFDNELFKRGKIKSCTDMEFIRVYIDTVRELYENSDARHHKFLAYIFRLVPWMNRYYNVACKNIYESDIDKIQMLTITEICDIIGYDKTNFARLRKELSKLRIGDERVFGYFVLDDASKASVFINPKLYYSGSDNEIINMLRALFKPKQHE